MMLKFGDPDWIFCDELHMKVTQICDEKIVKKITALRYILASYFSINMFSVVV